MRRRCRIFSLIAFALISLPLSATEEPLSEIDLSAGGVVMGRILAETDDVITVKRIVRLPGGEVAKEVQYQRRAIERIWTAEEIIAEYDRRAAAMEATADTHVDLATWCSVRLLFARAVHHARQALLLDSKHVGARALLAEAGYSEVDGEWLDATELLTEKGLVRYNGHLLPVKDAEAARARDRQLAQQETNRRKLSESRNRIDAAMRDHERAVADVAKREQTIETLRVEAETRGRTFEEAKKDMLVAEEQFKAAQRLSHHDHGHTSDHGHVVSEHVLHQIAVSEGNYRAAGRLCELASKSHVAALTQLRTERNNVIRANERVEQLTATLIRLRTEAAALTAEAARLADLTSAKDVTPTKE